MAATVYPEWVRQFREKGTTIKKVGNNYYLYKHSSKRVKGKTNPVPVDTYIGKITHDGVEKNGTKKVKPGKDEVIVKEYGFSKAVEMLCPDEWKNIHGSKWQELLDFIIREQSPETYIAEVRKIPDSIDPHIQVAAQISAVSRRIYKKYGVGFVELKALSTIYLVIIGKHKMVSRISGEQEKLLEELGIRLEV